MNLLLAHLRLGNLIEQRLSETLSDITYVVAIKTETTAKTLTPIQAFALALMLRHSQARTSQAASPLSAKEIANRLGCSRTTVQACLMPLLAADLVAASPGDADKRVIRYVLTPDGEALAEFAAHRIKICESDLRRKLRSSRLSIAWKALLEI